jgi:hypothetical protein
MFVFLISLMCIGPRSTKIEALLEELARLKQRDCTIKSIVFSQYCNFLDILEWRVCRNFLCLYLANVLGVADARGPFLTVTKKTRTI